MLSIRAGSTVLQFTGGSAGQIEGVVDIAVGQEFGITGDLSPEEAEPEPAVELGSQRLGQAVTHEVGSSNGQEVVGDPVIRLIFAHNFFQT